MDAIKLIFVEHTRYDACDHCAFRVKPDDGGYYECLADHTDANDKRIQCRAYHQTTMPDGRKDGKDGYWKYDLD